MDPVAILCDLGEPDGRLAGCDRRCLAQRTSDGRRRGVGAGGLLSLSTARIQTR